MKMLRMNDLQSFYLLYWGSSTAHVVLMCFKLQSRSTIVKDLPVSHNCTVSYNPIIVAGVSYSFNIFKFF
jgi:hypothetical protein